MHFYNLINEISKKEDIVVFIDMDGVISSYDFGKPLDFINKRPLETNINTLKSISEIDNVELCILSVCRLDSQIKDKNEWLDKYAPFFKRNNRVILSKESSVFKTSKELKTNYLKTLSGKKTVFVDDDNEVLKYISENVNNILLYQDSELID